MSDTKRIDLAHAPGFALGALSVRPGTREVVGGDGVVEVLEPRVMQVLVALAQANGGIVSRDDLTRRCWEDRIVGEDAINRVISRLRRVAEGIGSGSFRVETITKVGYRLMTDDAVPSADRREANTPAAAPPPTRRRLLLGGGAVATLAVAGGAGLWVARSRHAPEPAPVSPEVAALMGQAELGLRQGTREGQNQAIGLYQRVVALAPGYADGWGALGTAYIATAHFRATPESESLRARAKAAADRALAIDPDNAYGQVAIASMHGTMGHWLAIEQALRKAISQFPRTTSLLYSLGVNLAEVGRAGDAAASFDTIAKLEPPSPDTLFKHFMLLWSANRLEEADRLMDEAATLFPTHFANWFGRFFVLTYSGRPAQALAMAQNPDLRPSGIPDGEVESVVRVAHAIETRAPADIEAVMREHMARARLGNGYAENTIQYASALGRIDDAFAVAEAYYFERGFVVPEVRFSRAQGTYLPRGDRLTAFLFNPSTVAMRADARFAPLVRELGLEDYWKASGTVPDYRRR